MVAPSAVAASANTATSEAAILHRVSCATEQQICLAFFRYN